MVPASVSLTDWPKLRVRDLSLVREIFLEVGLSYGRRGLSVIFRVLPRDHLFYFFLLVFGLHVSVISPITSPPAMMLYDTMHGKHVFTFMLFLPFALLLCVTAVASPSLCAVRMADIMSRLSRTLPPADYTTDEASFRGELEGRRRVSPALPQHKTNWMQSACCDPLCRPAHLFIIRNQYALTKAAVFPLSHRTPRREWVRTGPQLTHQHRRFVSTIASPAAAAKPHCAATTNKHDLCYMTPKIRSYSRTPCSSIL